MLPRIKEIATSINVAAIVVLAPYKTLENTVAYSALVTFPLGLKFFIGVPSALIHIILYAYAV